MTSSDAGTLGTDTPWQRLSPAAMVHFAVQFVLHVVRGGVQVWAPVAGGIVAAGDKRWLLLGLGLPLGLGVLAIASLLSYLHFRFRLNGGAFLIQKGVIQKKRLSLAYDRIQNVVIKEPIYFRPFGLVELGLESAGSAAEEVSLGGIPRALANRLRAAVLERRHEMATAADTAAAGPVAAPAPAPAQLLHQPVDELIRYGLSNNNVWVFAGLLAAALSQMEDQLENLLGHMVADRFADIEQTGLAVLLLLGFGIAALVLLLLMAASVLGAVIVYHDYRLSHGDGRFLRTKGLFERTETSLPDGKVQSLAIDQPWPALLMRRWHLTLKQIGFTAANDELRMPTPKSKFVIPSVQAPFIARLVGILMPALDWPALSFRGIDRYFIRKTFTYLLVPPVLIPAGVLGYHLGFIGLLPLLIPLLLLPFTVQRWRRYGYWSDGRHGVVRSGFIGSTLRVFAFHKVQTVAYRQSPGERRRGLAGLTVKLAGDTIRIPAMPLEDARAWHDDILGAIHRRKRR